MTILENTPHRLIVEHVPWGLLASLLGFMSIWVAGSILFILDGTLGPALIFLALGTFVPLLAIWGLVQRNQLVFDRAQGLVEHRRRSFRGFSRQHFALENVKRSYVSRDTPKYGSLFLETTGGMDAGHHRFLATNAKLPHVIEASDAINAWLDPA